MFFSSDDGSSFCFAQLLKSPGFTLLALITLALGIGPYFASTDDVID